MSAPSGWLRTLRLLGAEACANTRAWATLAIPFGLLSLGLGFVVTWPTVTTAERSIAEITALDEGGRQVLRVVPPQGTPIPAGFCDRLQALDSVAAAYGIGEIEQARLSTGALITVQEATAGIDNYLHLSRTEYAGTTALAGSSVSERNGFVDGAWVQFGELAPPTLAGRFAQTVVVDQSERTTNLDDSLIVDLPLSGSAIECRVEPVPGARLDLAGGLPALSSSGDRLEVAPLRPDIETEDEPDRRLAGLPGNLATLGSGILLGLVMLSWWYIRRAEWALYRTYGLSTAALGVLGLLEWALVCALPLVVGGLWGIAATTPGSIEVAYRLAAANLVITGLVSATAIGLWTAFTRAFSPALALRGL